MELLDNLSDLEVLTLTLIGESRGEPIEGQVAVASVIRNRANSFNKSFKDICLAPKQFSCWNTDDPNYILLEELARRFVLGNKLDIPSHIQCQCVARGIIKNEILDNIHGALNYLSNALYVSDHKPDWAANPTLVIVKGSQIFIKI